MEQIMISPPPKNKVTQPEMRGHWKYTRGFAQSSFFVLGNLTPNSPLSVANIGVKQIQKFKITMEVGGWVQVLLRKK